MDAPKLFERMECLFAQLLLMNNKLAALGAVEGGFLRLLQAPSKGRICS